jgi:hypothetical protein
MLNNIVPENHLRVEKQLGIKNEPGVNSSSTKLYKTEENDDSLGNLFVNTKSENLTNLNSIDEKYDQYIFSESRQGTAKFSPPKGNFFSYKKYDFQKCTYHGCTKTFKTPGYLRAHMALHTGEKLYA